MQRRKPRRACCPSRRRFRGRGAGQHVPSPFSFQGWRTTQHQWIGVRKDVGSKEHVRPQAEDRHADQILAKATAGRPRGLPGSCFSFSATSIGNAARKRAFGRVRRGGVRYLQRFTGGRTPGSRMKAVRLGEVGFGGLGVPMKHRPNFFARRGALRTGATRVCFDIEVCSKQPAGRGV